MTTAARRSVALSLGTLLLLTGACSSARESASDDDLVGGRLAAGDEFPATILIAGSCTAAKVGPRQLLTAAHCASGDSGSSKLYPKAELVVTTQRVVSDAPVADAHVVEIERVLIHPGWQGSAAAAFQGDPDVAVIVVTEESAALLSSIPVANVDPSPVSPGDPVVIMGYGCEEGLRPHRESGSNERRLKVQKVRALSWDEAFAEERDSLDRLPPNYFPTPGLLRDPSAASICPGDSGGPVYRDDGTERTIVGVNAYYNFLQEDEVRISYANWHTRLDLQASQNVGQWLIDAIAGRDVASATLACPGPGPKRPREMIPGFEWKAPKVAKGSCGEDDMKRLATMFDDSGLTDLSILSGESALSESCRACILSKENDAAWQPLVLHQDVPLLNPAACYAAVEGEACGASYVERKRCFQSTCTQCPATEEAIQACRAQAASEVCAPFDDAEKRACPRFNATAVACRTAMDVVQAICGS